MNTQTLKKSRTTIVYALGVALLCGAARAEEPVGAKGEEGEQEELPIEAGVDIDLFSAYVWRNAIQSDQLVIQPCVWADWTFKDPFWVGFSVWQNYNLTSRRNRFVSRGLDETDLNLHLAATAWATEDEAYSLELEIGHDWNMMHNIRHGFGMSYPTTRELYAKATFNNPFVNVYGQASWLYKDFGDYQQGFHYELGFNREFELVKDTLKFGADWNVSFANGHYLQFLFGDVNYREIADDEGNVEELSDRPGSGFGGTTLKAYLSWNIVGGLSLKGTIAYTGLIHPDLRDTVDELGGDFGFAERNHEAYPRDLLWGGLSLNYEF